MTEDNSEAELSNSDVDSDAEKKSEADKDGKRIREQLSTMSFEDLQKLKDEMGAKLYNQTVHGVKRTQVKNSFKRANKNRPREESSKKRVKQQNSVNSIKRNQPKDPRFEPMCGAFDRRTFKENYKFVNDLRKREKRQLEGELKVMADPEQKKKIKFVIQRLENQIREGDNSDKVEQQKFAEKKEITDKLKRGEKVHFKKKSIKRLESLISKYEELKKTNKLQKHIERRSKKLSVKERKTLEREKLFP